jgi:excisionase family DNA binding protein
MIALAKTIDESMTGKKYFTSAEAAEILELTRDTVQHYCQGESPKINAEKIGRDWLIPKSEIDRYKRERRTVGRPPGE